VHAALASSQDARMILTVHDELLFEVPENRAEEVAQVVRDRMQAAAPLVVPLTVDIGVGKNWTAAKSGHSLRCRRLLPGPAALEALPFLAKRFRRLPESAGPFRDEGRQHESIEIGSQRRSSIAGHRGPHPSCLHRFPRALKIPLPAGGHRNPVRGGCAGGNRAQFALHPLANALIHGLAIELRSRPRITVECAGPPVEDSLVFRRCQGARSFEDRIENTSGRSERAVEIQRLSQTDDVLDPFVSTKTLGIESAQALTGAVELFRLGPFAVELEVSSRGDEVRAIDARRSLTSLVGCRDRSLELTLVVKRPGASQRIALLASETDCREREEEASYGAKPSHRWDGNTCT